VLIDLDPQGSAIAWHQVRGQDAPNVVAGNADTLGNLLDAARGLGVTLAMIDTAPHADRGALSAIRAADLIVMPIRPSFLDVAAMRDTIPLLKLAGKMGSAVAVLNAVPLRGGLADEAAEALAQFKVKIVPVRVAQRNLFASAMSQGKGVTELAPKDAASAEIKALWNRLNAFPSIGKKGK
jgi:chromosome partitioning protein